MIWKPNRIVVGLAVMFLLQELQLLSAVGAATTTTVSVGRPAAGLSSSRRAPPSSLLTSSTGRGWGASTRSSFSPLNVTASSTTPFGVGGTGNKNKTTSSESNTPDDDPPFDNDDAEEYYYFEEWVEDDWFCWTIDDEMDDGWYPDLYVDDNDTVCYPEDKEYEEEEFLDDEDVYYDDSDLDEYEVVEEWEEDEANEKETVDRYFNRPKAELQEPKQQQKRPSPKLQSKQPSKLQQHQEEHDELLLVKEWIHEVLPEDDIQLEMPSQLASQYLPYEQQPNFLVASNLKAGEIEEVRWRDDGEFLEDEDIFQIGLPPQLLQEFQTYFDSHHSGLFDLVREILYPTTRTANSTEEEENHLWTLRDGHKWSLKRANHWDTDMVWFDPADEACYERLLYILQKSGFFETCLQPLRNHLEEPRLTVHGLGAIFVGKFDFPKSVDELHLHRDVPNTRGAFYNILVPIHLPIDGAESSLYIGGNGQDDDDNEMISVCSKMNLQYNRGLVVGSDSWHGTGECNYWSARDFRLSMSIWVSTIDDEQNLEVIANDGGQNLSPWPLHNDKAWYRSQANRNFFSDSNTTSEEEGRTPLEIRDERKDCSKVQHLCDTDLINVRAKCAKTCNVYMETNEYRSFLHSLKSL